MTAQEIFTQRLRQLIAEKNLEQKKLADKMSLTKTTVNAWFTGQAVPRFEPLIQLADLLGVSIDYLAGRTDDPKLRKPAKKE